MNIAVACVTDLVSLKVYIELHAEAGVAVVPLSTWNMLCEKHSTYKGTRHIVPDLGTVITTKLVDGHWQIWCGKIRVHVVLPNGTYQW